MEYRNAKGQLHRTEGKPVMNIKQMKQALDDYGEHLNVVFEMDMDDSSYVLEFNDAYIDRNGALVIPIRAESA